MKLWAIEVGLSRRLIPAHTADDAFVLFRYETPERAALILDRSDVCIREASAEEYAEFQRSRKHRPSEDQIAFDLCTRGPG